MDATTAAILGGGAGVLLGSMSVISLRISERSQRRMAEEPPPSSVPVGGAAVLAVLGSIAVVLDADERVVNNAPTAVALGLVKDERLIHPRLLEAVRTVARDGVIRELEFQVVSGRPRRAAAYLKARVAPLLDTHVLVLIDDQTKARLVEEVRRDFVVNVSHELKTPVGGLSLLAEAILDAKDDPEAIARFAQRMKLESARLGTLIKEIVDLSRLQSADGLTDARPVRILDVITEAVDLSLVEATAKDIAIVEGVDTEIEVLGDVGLLVTAVRNLVSNAIAHSPVGTEVGIGARASGSEATITVTDRGSGIPEVEQERIFERFYRVDAARSRSTGGTGLGLAIVKHICNNHGGTVRVWSQEGQGSTFTITLPLLTPTGHPAGSPSPEGHLA